MEKRFLVKRVVSVLQAITVFAKNDAEAVEKARGSKYKTWKTLDNKRRKNYTAEAVVLGR